jgi:hypothetical protein
MLPKFNGFFGNLWLTIPRFSRIKKCHWFWF